MSNERFCWEDFHFSGNQDDLSSTQKSFDRNEGEDTQEEIRFCGADDSWGESWSFDIPSVSVSTSPPLEKCLDEITKLSDIESGMRDVIEVKKARQLPFSLTSLELLPKHANSKLWNKQRHNDQSPTDQVEKQELSTEEVIRVAGARFIQSSKLVDVEFIHPLDLSFSSLSDDEVKNVELAQLLLASSEKVGYQQFDSASRLLDLCDHLSSNTGNPVQRLVYYFSGALRERINREKGRDTSSKDLGKKQSFDIYEAMKAPSLSIMAFYEQSPFCKVSHYAGIQAIVENVREAKRIHIIDLEIRSGLQWTIFMQALVSRDEWPIELLKITAVGTTTSKQLIEDTGKRLTSFAQTMNLCFSFKVVTVSDMQDLKEDHFELDSEEKLAVFSEYFLTSLIGAPNRLDSLMMVIRKINPCVMVITEVEANHNSPVFVNRFIETLFYVSSYFDCLETCMKRDDQNRMFAESIFFGEGIRKILVAEGEERNIRNVRIDVWRAYFARFLMEETEMSMSSLYQANLIANEVARGKGCTLNMDAKTLIIGWKGTPIHSLSVWMFL